MGNAGIGTVSLCIFLLCIYSCYPVVILVVFIIAVFITDHEKKQQAGCNTNSKTGNIDGRKDCMSFDIPDGDLKIVLNHWLLNSKSSKQISLFAPQTFHGVR